MTLTRLGRTPSTTVRWSATKINTPTTTKSLILASHFSNTGLLMPSQRSGPPPLWSASLRWRMPDDITFGRNCDRNDADLEGRDRATACSRQDKF